MSEPNSFVEKVLKTRTVASAQKFFGSKYGAVLVGAISFIESALPIPLLTDPFLAAAILAKRSRAVRLVVWTTITSVIGGLVAYGTALLFRDPLLSLLSPEIQTGITELINSQGDSIFLLALLGAVTPIPYTFACWAVGLMQGNPLLFILASFIGRGFRYTVVGWCTFQFGPTAVTYAKRYIALTSILLFILAGLYVWYKM